ncbi:MAG TPA: hypothetical protein VHT27_12155 [Solirubrobacteraceae bacterium]|jgi:hypothetical protein|nr:hypothetical protein [Solirubrobacteraceae bacterium]
MHRGTAGRLARLAATAAAATFVTLAPTVAGASSAAKAVTARSTVAAAGARAEAANCVIHTLSGLMRQGEFGQAGNVGDIVEVECNPAVFPGGTPVEISDAQLQSRCSLSGGTVTWVEPNVFPAGGLKVEKGNGITVNLDGDGNATVALVAGPNCAVGGTVVSGHTLPGEGNTTVESFSASFAVIAAAPTPEGVTVMPSEQVEDEGSSAVATLLQVEFPSTEAKTRVAAPELAARCEVAPHMLWLRPNGELVETKELAGGTATEPTGREALRTDNDGNAFVIAIGDASCKPGKSFFEVDLEAAPFTTEEQPFTILPPQPTPEPAFSIQKLQHIAGAGGAFTSEPLTATSGQTVEYEIVVTNETSVPETFAEFLDANCDANTITGGPSGPVASGGSTTYRCTRLLTKSGTFTNQAEVTGITVGGMPLPKSSNVVQVTVAEPPRPSFTIEKQQRIGGGSYTPLPLTGQLGETVEYEIIAHNTGNTPLSFSEFVDPNCAAGTIHGGPAGEVAAGATATWTCTRVLGSEGTFVNIATVIGTAPGGSPEMEASQPVEVVVAGPGLGAGQLAIEKRQRVAGSGASFTAEPIETTVGHTVEYEIVVKNVGTAAETITALNDPFCEAGTLGGGQGALPLQPGAQTTYTCSRAVGAAGTYVNVAAVVTTPLGGGSVEQPSAPVVAKAQNAPAATGSSSPVPKVKVAEACTASAPRLHGATGTKRGRFTVTVSSGGIKQITFYLDGHRLRTLSSAQARKGRFSIQINAAKLRHGAHRVSVAVTMADVNCAKAATSREFVRPAAAHANFTG